MLNKLIKKAFNLAGLKVERRDPLLESIPADYQQSPFLPRIYRGGMQRLFYFRDQIERTRDIPGDIIECGVSLGHGMLCFILLSEWIGTDRIFYGFDSFEGFPSPNEKDEVTPITGKGFWASPPEAVLTVLRDGRVPEPIIQSKVRLVRGWFQNTVPKYEGNIALLHLDCDLYDSYRVCLESLYGKVSRGGIIMFDEYGDTRWPGAKKAIDQFFEDKPEYLEQHNYGKYYVVKQ